MIVYISGALKASRDLDRARALYEWAAHAVRAAGGQPYLPHQHTDPERNALTSPAEVFQRDVTELMAADGVLAFLGEPSLGVGAELALCAQTGIPVLGVYTPSDSVSRFATGLLEAVGNRYVRYANLDELEVEIGSFLKELRGIKTPRRPYHLHRAGKELLTT